VGLKMKNIITVLFLGCYSLVFTQFNTLTPKKVTSNEILKEQQSFQKQSTFKIEKEQKSIINRLFNAPTKKNLKKEIDSLKTLMLRYNVSRIEESKADSKIDNDSLLQNYKKQSTNLENSNTEKRIKKFDFVNEEESISKISMPLNNRMMVTSPFGWRVHPIFGANKLHNGADFKANYENVYAVLDGVVIASGWDLGGGGNYIKIRHSNSFITSYQIGRAHV
jgi:murein DD-endopeptidase MepM/ murein hydrolase activator NlpD